MLCRAHDVYCNHQQARSFATIRLLLIGVAPLGRFIVCLFVVRATYNTFHVNCAYAE